MPLPPWLQRAAACTLATLPVATSANQWGSEASYFEPLPVVLTVSRLPQPVRETPGAVTVIDEELIRATDYRDIARLLRLVPGMQVGQERGNHQGVIYHGLIGDYANQMQVLIDGRSAYSPDFFGGADWGALPLAAEDIERIEVVRGSDSAAYGANAFLGVVNILTRHTAAETGPSVSARVGSHGIADFSGRVVAHHGPLGVRLSARQQADEGAGKLHDDRRMGMVNLRMDLRLGDTDEIGLSAGLSQGRRDLGYGGTPYNVQGLHDATNEDSFTQLRWVHAPSPDEELELSWYRNREHTDEMWFGEGEVPPFGFLRVPVVRNRSSRRDNLSVQHHFSASRSLRVLWGAEWRYYQLDAPILFFGKGTRRQRENRLFGNLEWRAAPDWLWNIGLMAERIDDHRPDLAPRLFLNWNPTPGQTWRLGYSRGFRHPILFERYADVRIVAPSLGQTIYRQFVANPDIKTQSVNAYELGYIGVLADPELSLDVRLFHERVANLIRSRPLPSATPLTPIEALLPTSSWGNESRPIELNGIEYSLRAGLGRGGELIFNHALIDCRAQDATVERTVAPYSASLTWLQRTGPWQSTLTLLRVGPIDAGVGLAPGYRYTVPAYTTLDASLGWETQLGGHPVELRLSGINLLGRHQELASRLVQALSGGNKPVNEVGPQVHVGLHARF